ncbi:MAG: DUF560 domain-containing protein [Ignavibacteria bacterium]|nr:DUF560 domain-containing protein [Ignavibacteria bacterium]
MVSFRWAGFSICALSMFVCNVQGQSVNLSMSTVHDENIFDTYAPTSDQISQLRADASKDWDFDQAWLGISYNGGLLLYQNTSARNYHVHILSLGSIYHLESHDDNDDNSAGSIESDSTVEDSAAMKPQLLQKQPAAVHSDSLDHYFYGNVSGGSQFNKTDFQEYDHSVIGGTIVFRQPLGANVSIRPFYSVGYHSYPNLSSLTNVQNTVGLLVGTSPISGSWIGISGMYGHKIYPTSTDFTYTFRDTTGGANGYGHGVGHGKGNSGSGNNGSGKTKTITYNFTTPSVSQFSLNVFWQQKVFSNTHFSIQVSYFGHPSSQARIIPERIQSAIESRGGSLENLTSQDIFDDRFAYSGDEITLHLDHLLPYQISFSVEGHIQGKTFTSPATSLAGDTLDTHRIDKRYEIVLNLSKSFTVLGGKTISPQLEFHYLRNNSNEPFYDFDKSVILAGMEFEF